MPSTTSRLIFATTLFAGAVVACGGKVVVDPAGGESDASAGPGGASNGTGTTSGQGAEGTGGTASTSVQSSSSSGMPGACDGSACGAPCTVCNDVECFMGFCDDSGTCTMPTTECKLKGPGQPCPAGDQAGFFLCTGCGGGKGCTFFGCVINGFEGGDGTCCYDFVGGCAPNP